MWRVGLFVFAYARRRRQTRSLGMALLHNTIYIVCVYPDAPPFALALSIRVADRLFAVWPFVHGAKYDGIVAAPTARTKTTC